MKLYNLFESIILEEIEKSLQILSEGVSINDIDAIINGDDKGKHYHVSFDYRSPRGDVTNRWVQIYDYATTTAGNDAISAFEVSKDGAVTNQWKIFRLDRIENFKPSRVPFYKAISDRDPSVPKYNKTGNNSPTLSTVNNKAKFDYQYADSTLKQKARQIKTNLEKRKQELPIQSEPQVEPKQQVQPKSQIEPKQQNNKEREFKY